MINEKDRAKDRGYEHPSNVMQEKGHENGILLPIVIRDKVDWFKVPHERETHGEHVPDQTQAVFLETLDNLMLLTRMRHKVLLDHPTVHQRLHIELLLEDGSH